MNGHDEAAEGALLAYLSEDDREYLLGQGVRRRFRANDFVLMEGDPSDHVHVLVSGWVRVSTVVEDGREVLFGLRGPGEVLGDLAAINGWARTASCRAIEPCVAFQLTGAQFLAVLRARPEIAIRRKGQAVGSSRWKMDSFGIRAQIHIPEPECSITARANNGASVGEEERP